MKTAANFELSFGATLLAPQRTRFRLWAPDKNEVTLELENSKGISMQKGSDGWFAVEADCGAGTRYRYRVSADLLVPDPASRAQHGDVFGPSIVVDPHAYVWRATGWRNRPWHEAVIYEMHIGTMGGFRAALSRLPDLAALGITAIEIMPIGDFAGTRNWGYDGALIFAPEDAYGTPDDLKALIDGAHALGIMVFLDVVYNHFGPEGNFLNSYASAFFRSDIKTLWGSAIDFRQPQVRNFFIENALYWLLEYRFDGLRVDAGHAFEDPTILDELAARVREVVEPMRPVHLILEHDGNVASFLREDFNAQWNDDVHHALHVLLTGEKFGYYADYAGRAIQDLARCLQEGFAYQGEASPFRNCAPRGEPSADLPPTAFIFFLQCHDQTGNRPFGDRLASMCDPLALRAAIALQLLSPQIPMLFMGEEWGSTQPFLYFTSHSEELAEAIRIGRRDEFAMFPAFSDREKISKLPDPNDVQTFLTSIPDWDNAHDNGPHAEWISYYRNLLGIRHKFVVPRIPEARAIKSTVLGHKAISAQWRMKDGRVLSLFTNLDGVEATIPPHRSLDADEILFETDSGAARDIMQGRLRPHTTIAILTAHQ
ncbi:MAG TPA: malto-oligosyltrehalose trehalohydrolase [Rhodocyclaceae bacterium]|nr:malto-oligosyltrehalose trehalohydrolase [Rhodocyclaceae bacterium]